LRGKNKCCEAYGGVICLLEPSPHQISIFLDYRLPRKPYKVFANIPFNITTAIVIRLTMAQYPPEDAYLAMQKEAAEKFLGKPHESLYAVLLKPWFEVEMVHLRLYD